MNVAANQEPFPEVAHTTVALQLVALRVRAGRLEVLHMPHADGSMLPVFVPEQDEEISEAADARGQIVIGSRARSLQLEARGTPSDGLTAAYVHLVRPGTPNHPAATPAAGWTWRDHRRIPLPESDRQVVERAIGFVAQKLEQGDVGFGLVGIEFTVSELRAVHEAILRVSLDPSNFRKRVCRMVKEGLVEELRTRRPTATRPARLYRVASSSAE
jgi:hypothetical protein